MIHQLVVLTFAILMLSPSHAESNMPVESYVGSNSTEATLVFNGTVEYETTTSPQLRTLKKVITSQLEYIIGPMTQAKYTAIPKGDEEISNIQILSKRGNTLTIGYSYKGTIVLEYGPTDTYDIYLPKNPKKIFSASMVGAVNPCTDDHYQTEGDFWYFWSPDREGCKLKEGKDYTIVKGRFQRFVNTKISYPEYQNLPDENGYITIHVLFGMDDPTLSRNPLISKDINAYNYREFRRYLLQNGYKATTWNERQVRTIAKTLDGNTPFVETIQKGRLAYRFFYGPTGIDQDALGFHWFYKDAIENASIMMYEGHSGLGGNLDLDSVEADLKQPINFNTKRYQIFFFDSCTSYRYYNSAYFERKMTAADPNGTKKLDIFTNGLETTFSSMPDTTAALDMALEKALDYAQRGNGFESYQDLAKQIDSNNLFGVNGDEDNAPPSAIK